ncbi:MAG: putative sensor protein [Candidatus Saccharibacteria bacterium]|nr:putative sensor protein [Candidatus Saccharibacteria bacterium]
MAFNLFKKGGPGSHGKTGAAGTATAADLHDEKLKFEVIINSIKDGVILVDDQGVIQVCNPAAAAITAWPADEVTKISVQSVMTFVDEKGEALQESQNPFTIVFKNGEHYRDNKASLLNRDKKQLALSLDVTPLLDTDGKVTAAIAVFRDVSQERAEEAQRGDFISTASHEMRTPVAAIEGYLALALNAKVSTIDNRARDYLEKAHSATQHLGQLFQDLLTSAKAEDGRLTSHPGVVEIGSLLEQITNDLRFAAEKKGLFVEFTVGSSNSTLDATGGSAGGGKTVRPLYYTFADGDRLREVITNLFDNAVKYTPEGKITIGLTGDDKVVQYYVRDTGPGIPPEDADHLFQKFYRVDNSATRTIGGTGLGLFICRKIIELYQGRIWVESELGKGSTFYINLPRLTTQQAEKLQAEAAANPQLAPLGDGKGI